MNYDRRGRIALGTVTLLLGGHRVPRVARLPAHGRGDLGLLAVGFGLVTAGSLLAGGLDPVFAVGRDDAFLIESALTAIGVGVVVPSLYR